MMIHVVSTDGTVALPLVHYATTGAIEQITTLATLLEQGDNPLYLRWGSTDGWHGSSEFIASGQNGYRSIPESYKYKICCISSSFT